MVARCGTGELGLPDTWPPPSPLTDDQFRLPDQVVDALDPAVERLGYALVRPQNGVWLELASPRGYLHLVPWERLLAPLKRPVLRFPNHALRPQAPSDTLEIALCASAPMAKSSFAVVEEARLLARFWAFRSQHRVKIHLFTDLRAYHEAATGNWDLGDVQLHNPREAERYAAPKRTRHLTDSKEIVNPWLLWIRDSLRGASLDVVHFLAHGYLADARGAIALASTPVFNYDPGLSRFVGSVETTALLSQVGAWCLVLSGPPDNYSGPGLRELGDAVATARPGIVLVDEIGLDHGGDQFAAAVEMVFGGLADISAPMRAITCWTHPRGIGYPAMSRQDLQLTEDGRSSLIEAATQEVLTRGDAPAWVAAGTRYLEAQQAAWTTGPTESSSVDQDAIAALQSVAGLLERHVRHQFGTDIGGVT